MKTSRIMFVAALLILSGGLAACDNKTPKPKTEGSTVILQSSTGQVVDSACRVVDDSAITEKAKWVLTNVSDLHNMDISVKTDGGKVILSGTVWSVAEFHRVASAVGSVEGVKQVENRITVKFLI